MSSLAEYLKSSGMTQKAFADAVNVSQPTVNRWLSGSKPSWSKAAEIERLTEGKVAVASWVASNPPSENATGATE
ncbi:helix-turn-helix domain-containing protein [Marinibacterium profundimaris]|uniref:helix-turn-helix domain-containing protein n=1 Tax=Marinibacterium profundimaris TaxID=1679460 RepID=UPI000B51F8E9|nr:helix-turn-helix domain-containing protein [Marinibacterium profundimaris]